MIAETFNLTKVLYAILIIVTLPNCLGAMILIGIPVKPKWKTAGLLIGAEITLLVMLLMSVTR